MVEMRWLIKKDEYLHDGIVYSYGAPYKVLQYRHRLSSAKYGSGKAWSDWTDVPVVLEHYESSWKGVSDE